MAAKGCPGCEGPLHRGDYERKPRGALVAAASEAFRVRHSLCCGWCRRRALPPSVRFLGRRGVRGGGGVGRERRDAARLGRGSRESRDRGATPDVEALASVVAGGASALSALERAAGEVRAAATGCREAAAVPRGAARCGAREKRGARTYARRDHAVRGEIARTLDDVFGHGRSLFFAGDGVAIGTFLTHAEDAQSPMIRPPVVSVLPVELDRARPRRTAWTSRRPRRRACAGRHCD